MAKKERGLTKRGNVWWIRISIGGKLIQQSTGTGNKDAALQKLRDLLTQNDKGTYAEGADKVTVAELLALVRADYIRKNQRVDWCDLVIAHLLNDDSPFKYMKATKVGTDAINAYCEWRRASKGVQNPTLNRELAILRRAFHLGLEHDPPKIGRAPKFQMFEENEPRQGFFDKEMLETLEFELPEEVRPVARFAFFTGMRKGEILQLRWAWVNLDDGMIRLPGEFCKNGKPRAVPLVPELHNLLSELKAQRDGSWPHAEFIFTRAGEPIKSIHTAWCKAVERAELPEETKHLHDMRRSAVRNLVRSGVPESVAMRISGHRSRAVFERYNITSEDDLRDAAVKLHNYVNKPKNVVPMKKKRDAA